MRTLLLFRHAKSSWDNPKLSDHDRPLSERGRKAAPRMGQYMREHRLLPELIVCSTAVRTRETLTLAIEDLASSPPQVVFDVSLYEASHAEILRIVHGTAPDVQSLMLIGHNPGMQILAFALSCEDDTECRLRVAQKFPTAGLAIITFDVDDWSSIAPGTGVFRDFVTPKLLD